MTVPARPAGLWQRSVAWTLDGALLGPLSLLLTWPFIATSTAAFTRQTTLLLETCGQAMGRTIIDGIPLPALGMALMQDPALRQTVSGMDTALWSSTWPPLVMFIALSALYHAGLECGPRQATPGQRLMGLLVTDAQRQRLRPGRALLRHVAGAASWLSLNLGHLMAAVPPSHLALHDRLSQTRVWTATTRMPAWAIAWLALVATTQLALIAWWMAVSMATMQAALEHSLQ